MTTEMIRAAIRLSTNAIEVVHLPEPPAPWTAYSAWSYAPPREGWWEVISSLDPDRPRVDVHTYRAILERWCGTERPPLWPLQWPLVEDGIPTPPTSADDSLFAGYEYRSSVTWKGNTVWVTSPDGPCPVPGHRLGVLHHIDEHGRHYCPTGFLWCEECNGSTDEPPPYECTQSPGA